MRELHIKITKPKFINIAGVMILLGMLIFGMIIVRNVNKEFEIRQIAGAFQEYKYATLSFNNIYSGLPGDITNASFYWKDITTDGNGDKKIDFDSAETITAWQQLQLANLIKLPYTLTGKWNDTNGTGILVTNINIPSIHDADTGIFISYMAEFESNVFGISKTSGQSGLPKKPALTPNNAYMLDLMIDDGYPDKGGVIALPTGESDCFVGGEYKKELERKECVIIFKL